MSNPAIDTLNNDALLSIFDTITAKLPRHSPGTDRPLKDIRFASQVCRRWRTLILASPWIWGRLIDLQAASGQQPKWMEEVARRSGEAPLWIYGEVTEHTDEYAIWNTQRYFLRRLTSESWKRVEKLSVSMRTHNQEVLDRLRSLFLTRAPILKLFDVKLLGVEGSLYLNTLRPGSSQRLFADYAPCLRVMMADQIAFRLDAPWLSQIREISPFPRHLTTLEDTFAILKRTPIIEHIRIQNRNLLLVQPPPFKLALPNLSSMYLITRLPVLATILDHVAPGKLSRFYAQDLDAEIDNTNLPFILFSFKKNLPTYISNYFTAHPPTFLSLGLSPGYFELSDFPTINDIPVSAQRYFRFSIWTTTDSHQDDRDRLIECVVDAFIASSVPIPQGGSTSILESVTELRMDGTGLQPALIAKLSSSALAQLRHVREIHTTEVYAHTLLALTRPPPNEAGEDDPRPTILFPELHTIHLGTTELENGIFHAALTQFIIRRKDLGFPVAKLDLRKCEYSTYAQDLSELEAVAAGLEVIWRGKGDRDRGGGWAETETLSYICGSGDPARLKSFGLWRHRMEVYMLMGQEI